MENNVTIITNFLYLKMYLILIKLFSKLMFNDIIITIK